MQGEVEPSFIDVPRESLNDPGQVRHVANHYHSSRFGGQPVLEPFRWIIREESADRRELRERIADPPDRIRSLASAELSAMPDTRRFHRAGEQRVGDEGCLSMAGRGQRPLRIDDGIDGVGVVDQDNQTDPRISSVRVLRRPLPGFGKRR